MKSSSKCSTYQCFKFSLSMEKYLIQLPVDLRIPLTKYRLSSHRLPIEVGRHHGIVRSNRLCNLCTKREIGDEYHYLVSCNYFDKDRQFFLGIGENDIPNVSSLYKVFCCENIDNLRRLSLFVKCILKEF